MGKVRPRWVDSLLSTKAPSDGGVLGQRLSVNVSCAWKLWRPWEDFGDEHLGGRVIFFNGLSGRPGSMLPLSNLGG